jgi:hypothetical protein
MLTPEKERRRDVKAGEREEEMLTPEKRGGDVNGGEREAEM